MSDNFTLLFRNCKSESGTVERSKEDAFVSWATYADCLLHGMDIPVTLPDATPGAHITQVIIMVADEQGNLPLMSMYVACECIYPVDSEAKVESQLLHPEQHVNMPVKQIYIPKGTVR